MIYKNIKDIPYPFLHDAVLLMDKYTEGVIYTRMTPRGECAIKIKGELSNETIARCMMDLDPNVTAESSLSDYTPKMCVNYDYLEDVSGTVTVIYTKDNIDYREL